MPYDCCEAVAEESVHSDYRAANDGHGFERPVFARVAMSAIAAVAPRAFASQLGYVVSSYTGTREPKGAVVNGLDGISPKEKDWPA